MLTEMNFYEIDLAALGSDTEADDDDKRDN